jgi:hypothetical protein
MNPIITQAVGAQRVREMQEHAASWRRARQARLGSGAWTRIQRAARGPKSRARRALRDAAAA